MATEDTAGAPGSRLGIHHLIGQAPAFTQALADLPFVARSGATVVISGESGTGKELVARALHYLSPRAGCPFVPVNCGSLPETLLEAELFGHEPGAFTDARSKREGLIAQADRGTLFLDEVDTLPPKAQIDLLRVIQDRTYRAIGSNIERRANVLFLAASNAPIDQLVRAGVFRADLFFRLAVFRIHLPPLRERASDVLPLANHFLDKHTTDRERPALSVGARAALVGWQWPGNVRELENAIIRGIHLCQDGTIEAKDLRLHSGDGSGISVTMSATGSGSMSAAFATTATGSASGAYSGTTATPNGDPNSDLPLAQNGRRLRDMKQDVIASFEKGYLTNLLITHRGNVSRAATAAGKERRELGKLLKKYGLDPEQFRSQDPRD